MPLSRRTPLKASAFGPRKKNSGRAKETRSFPAHLAWLRKRPCILEGRHGHACEGRMEAAHVDHAGGKGTSLKVADYNAVPMCSESHRLYHQYGARTWEATWRIDLVDAARQYADKSPHKHLWAEQ